MPTTWPRSSSSPTGRGCRASSSRPSCATCAGPGWSGPAAGRAAATPWPLPANEITIGMILRAVDGPLAEVRGLRPHETSYVGAAENLPTLWVAVRSALRDVLDTTSLEQVRTGQAVGPGPPAGRGPGRLGEPLTVWVDAFVDVPPASAAAVRTFWSAVTGWEPLRAPRGSRPVPQPAAGPAGGPGVPAGAGAGRARRGCTWTWSARPAPVRRWRPRPRGSPAWGPLG